MKLRVATCQFPIGSDVHKNLEYVARQIKTARDRDADVAHFPEACLSGYAGSPSPPTRASIGLCSKGACRGCSTWHGSPASGSSSGRRTG
jgi:hypothetical protein